MDSLLGRWIAALAMALLWVGNASAQLDDPCKAPAGDPAPGTAEWHARDALLMYCSQQRHIDKAAHPLPVVASSRLSNTTAVGDRYRLPNRHDGTRFRFERRTIGTLAAELYRPCAAGTCENMPEELPTYEPPYPVAMVFHGGGSRKELHWWGSQTLAEAGYMVVAFDGADSNVPNARTVLDWMLATPGEPVAQGYNPYWEEVDRELGVGTAGHSRGAATSNMISHQEDRIWASVAWDGGSGPVPLEANTPSLFLVSDYTCQAIPVCLPYPHQEPPDPVRMVGFERVRDADVDTLRIVSRAAHHLDWVPSELAGNRYTEIVSVYYTIAWFDRYIKGARDPEMARDAFRRLTADVFDDSADVRNVSQGLYDPVQAALAGDLWAGNVPYTIAGTPVRNLLSFYHLSGCFLTDPDADPETPERAEATNIRATGCPASGE